MLWDVKGEEEKFEKSSRTNQFNFTYHSVDLFQQITLRNYIIETLLKGSYI